MAEQPIDQGNSLIGKVQTLMEVRSQLLNEFRELEELITDIIYQLKLWYLAPEKRREPLVIATQSQSSKNYPELIKRLSELLRFENAYFYFDLKTLLDTSPKHLNALNKVALTHNGKVLFVSVIGNEQNFNLKDSLLNLNENNTKTSKISVHKSETKPVNVSQWVFFINAPEMKIFPQGMDADEAYGYRTSKLLRLLRQKCSLKIDL